MSVRRASVVVGLVVAALLVGGGSASGASADPSASPSASSGDGDGSAQGLVSFGIAPSGADRPDDRPYVAVSAPPGAVVYEHVALINQTAIPLDLSVYARDVVMADGGGLGVQTRDAAAADAGAWISTDTPASVTVPAQTDQGYGFTVVPITIAIPADAEPGEHIAGFVASLVTSGAGGENAPNLELEQRVAARIYITVQGEIQAQLTVTDVSATWEPHGFLGSGDVVVDYTLENRGNVRLAVAPSVSVAGPFGLLTRGATGTTVDELLPGGTVRMSTTVPGVWALVRHDVRVDAVASAARGGADPGLGTVTGRAVLWAVPWFAIGVLVLLVLLVVLARLRRRRRLARRRSAPEGSRRARRHGGTPDAPSEVAAPVATP